MQKAPLLLTLMAPSISEEAAPSVSVPLATLTVVAELIVRLRAESLEPVVTVPLVRLITA